MYRRRLTISLILVLIIVFIILVSVSLLNFFIPDPNTWANIDTQIDQLHDLGFYGSGVTIGIICTGVDVNHQEFDLSSFIAWNDSKNEELDFYDDCDHGTHIAGILVSKGSYQGLFSGIKLKGIAPEAQLIIVKSLSENDCYYGGVIDNSIADGIKFCIDNNADIICLSLGKNPEELNFDDKNKTLDMCEQAISQGIFVISPAGNDGQNDDGDVSFPSSLENVISVGAIGKDSSVASFSSKGHQYTYTNNPNKKPEVIAPGVGIMSTRANGAYGELSGTSQATIYVAGIIALLLEAYPDYKPGGSKNQNEMTINIIKDALAKTAKKIGSLEGNSEQYSHNDYYGYGLIQAYDLYEELAKY